MSLYFSAVNRNKRSVALDLKHPQGRGILLQLAKQADVVIDNFIPGKMDNLQIGYDVLSGVNPKIVHASISGYGQTGPYAKRAGYDLIAGAEAGLLHITGETDGRPLKPGLGLTDMCTGLYTHGAILAALRSRDVLGKGQAIDTSLFETQISLMSNVAMSWLNLGQESQRWGNGHPTIAPYDSFETKDSHIVVGAVNDRQYKKLCMLLGCDELADTDQYATNPDRVLHRDSLMNELQTIFRTKTTEEWCAVFEGSGMPYGPINTIEKAFEHPQVGARTAVTTIEDSRVVTGYLKVLNPAVAFSGDDVGIRTAAPSLGQHTDQVLKEIGFSTLEIDNFRIDRVIG
ncbi:hypothetical protein VHEMI09870 [[Torrubiella] hemipterigena]|nr:hypothetical protein VHEMI09870 [[Torrubiella] hemipterigena]